jgi:hypothetical protein
MSLLGRYIVHVCWVDMFGATGVRRATAALARRIATCLRIRGGNVFEGSEGVVVLEADSHPFFHKTATELVAQEITEVSTLNQTGAVDHSDRKGIFQLRLACCQRKLLAAEISRCLAHERYTQASTIQARHAFESHR